jgi:ferrochelatase
MTASRAARAYKKIWTDAGSPMHIIYTSLVDEVRVQCQEQWGTQLVVAAGNTYGNPSISAALEELRQADAQRIVVLPMYPQYTAVTIGSVFDRVAEELTRWRWVPELRFVSGYHDLPGYLDAIADSIRNHWDANGRGDKLVFSYHSLPTAYANAGDPYFCICSKTSRKLAARLGLNDKEWVMSFQSTFVGGDWLGPDLEDSLEEIVDRNHEGTGSAEEGGLRFIPCLNDSPAHVAMFAELVRIQVQGWEDVLSPVGAVPSIPADLHGELTARRS